MELWRRVQLDGCRVVATTDVGDARRSKSNLSRQTRIEVLHVGIVLLYGRESESTPRVERRLRCYRLEDCDLIGALRHGRRREY